LFLLIKTVSGSRWRGCQANANQSLLFADEQVLGDEKVAPLAKSGVAFLFGLGSRVYVPFEESLTLERQLLSALSRPRIL
jgi:hypothetical protein